MSTERTTLAVRLFDLALRILPLRFRARYRDEMRRTFADLYDEAVREGGWRRGARAAAAEAPGLISLAAREHAMAMAERRRARHLARLQRERFPSEPRSSQMLDSFRHDVRYALRGLVKSPGFSAVAILTLALGIGANTAIFSVVHGVLLKPLPYREPGRLVAIGEGRRDGPPNALNSTSPGSFFDVERAMKTFTSIGAYTGDQMTLTGRGEPESMAGIGVVGGLFEVLGVPALIGRTAIERDEQPMSPPVVVLAYKTWRRLYDEDRRAVGQTLILNGTAFTIIGVMPPDFDFPGGSIEYWKPEQFAPEFRANRDQYMLGLVGRLRPGETEATARAELATVAARLSADYAQYNTGLQLNVVPMRDTVVSGVTTRLYILMGAVAFVLLITCANLGNMLLARATARRREIAVRQALGADRGRVLRQLLTESVILALAGGAAGLLLAKGVLRALLASWGTTLPRTGEIGLHPAVLGFTLLVSLLAGVAFGLVPAMQLGSSSTIDALRDGSKGSGSHRLARNALVISELALAMMLLAGTGLLLRSFALLQRVDPGFPTERALTFNVRRAEFTPANATFFMSTLERLRQLPGVRSVAVVSQLPVTGRGIGAWFNIFERPLPPNTTPPGEAYRVVSPDYFATMGIPLLRGRQLTNDDRRDRNPSVVVNDALARKYWPGADPIGKEIYLGAPDNFLFPRATIVGIVGNTKDMGLDADPLPTVFIPLNLMPAWPGFSYVIRTTGDPAALAAAARREIHAVDPAIPIRGMKEMDDVLRESVAPARWSMLLLAGFAGVALVMAALGVFGVLSFVVSQRTKELGIRMALGAEPGRVRGMVVGQGLGLALAGLAVGLAGALALTRFMSSMLFGVAPTDPLTFVAVSILLLAIAALASYLPARRATRVDPLVALRAE